MKRHFILVVTCLLAALGGSAKTFEWRISTPSVRAETFTAYHGETVRFNLVFSGAMSNVSAQAIYYQTNGMGSADYFPPIPGTVFAPSNDIGAAEYRFFIRCRDADGVDYTANGRLRLLDSPGFEPSVVELPVKSLDFANVEVANAPYYTKDETDSRIVELSPTPGDYANVSNRAVNAVQRDADWQDISTKLMAINRDFPYPTTHFDWYFSGLSSAAIQLYYQFGPTYPAELAWDIESGRWTGGQRGYGMYPFAYLHEVSAAATAATNYTDEAIASLAPPEVDLTDYATHAQATNAARAVSAPLEENVGVLWQYVLGDTVWFAVTNYMRTVEGVVPSLQLWEVRDGATNLVYHSTEEITNFVNAANAALRADVTNAMPSKAWSRYQSATGAENPQPGDITIVSTPSIMMTGGGEWNRYVHTGGSSVWVLRSNGLTTFGGGSNGSFFAVQDDEGNTQFEVRRTDSYEVDALPSATGFDGDDFQVTYNLPASGNPPTLYASTNLATTAFAAEENGSIDSLGITVNWASSGGLWRATIVQDVKAPALFVHAKALQEGSIVVKNNAPTSLSGGIYIGKTKYTLGTATISGYTVLTLTPAP